MSRVPSNQSDPSNEINPFSFNASAPLSNMPVPMVVTDATVFRDGDLVAARRSGAKFERRCVKTNEPTDQMLKRTLFYVNPFLIVLMFVHPVIYLIVLLIVRKKAVLFVPFSAAALAVRARNMTIAWTVGLFGIAAFIGGLVVLLNDSFQLKEVAIGLVIGGSILFLAGVIIGIVGCRMIRATYADDHFVWFKGTSFAYRDTLPEWPYGKVR